MAAHTIDKNGIVHALREVGVREGGILMVHSSLKSLGWVNGGAGAVIEALLQAIGPDGTLLMPTITGAATDAPNHPPIFDVIESPGWTGRLPETLRRWPGARRSWHPTHSVAALGPAAEHLLRDHHRSPTPCGWNTPYGRLIHEGGKVLFIGVTFDCCTLMHAFEEFAGVDYHMQKEPVDCVIIPPPGEGVRFTARLGLHWWNPAAPRDFPAMEPALREAGALTLGHAGPAPLRLLDARLAHDIVMAELKKNPRALLKQEE